LALANVEALADGEVTPAPKDSTKVSKYKYNADGTKDCVLPGSAC